MLQVPNRQIEMNNARTFEEFRLRGCSPERIREIAVVSSAYDSIISTGFTYVSTPITSGAILYQAMDEAGVSTPDELKRDRDLFRRKVMIPNLRAAEEVARAMLAFGGAVIAPAAFEARSLDWDQDAYMGLWLDTIERKATRLAMVDGWEYSNGGAEEYLQALLMQAGRRDRNDIEIVDARGETLMHDAALELLASAVDALMLRGFAPTTLARVLNHAITLHGMVEDEGRYGQLADTCGRTVFKISPSYGEAMPRRGSLASAIRSLRGLHRDSRRLLPTQEATATSSAEMSPGLVRSEGRAELSSRMASVTTTDDDN